MFLVLEDLAFAEAKLVTWEFAGVGSEGSLLPWCQLLRFPRQGLYV